jgi:hypothetical protein
MQGITMMLPEQECSVCGVAGGHALRCPKGHGTRMKHLVSPSDAQEARNKFNNNLALIASGSSVKLCDECRGGGLQEDGFPCEQCNGKGIKW